MSMTDWKDCAKLCVEDDNCKGFAIIHGNHAQCQVATTSDCPDICEDDTSSDNTGPLTETGYCMIDKEWNGGCFIRVNGNCKMINP